MREGYISALEAKQFSPAIRPNSGHEHGVGSAFFDELHWY